MNTEVITNLHILNGNHRDEIALIHEDIQSRAHTYYWTPQMVAERIAEQTAKVNQKFQNERELLIESGKAHDRAVKVIGQDYIEYVDGHIEMTA